MDENSQTQTRDMPSLSVRAAFQPKSCNDDKRTVDLTFTTGARVLRGFWERFWEELSLDPKHVRMDRLNNGAPLLDSHAMGGGVGRVLGVVESARLDGNKGVATVRFAKAEDDPEADKIYRKVKDGIIQNVSVGYNTYRMEKVESGADKIAVYRATDWEPFEVSLVPVGADDGAGTRSMEQRNQHACVIATQHEENRTMDPNDKTPKPADPVPVPVDLEAVRAQGAAAERTRIDTITKLCRTHRMDDKFVSELTGKDVSIEAARSLILDQLATRSAAPTEQHTVIMAGADASEKRIRGMTAWMLTKAGAADVVRSAAKNKPDHAEFKDVALDPGEFRGLSMIDMAREFLEAGGIRTRGMSKMDLVGAALTRGGLNSTSDFAVLLENVLHKVLLAQYATTPDTWSAFCSVGSVSDFRPHPRYRLGTFGTLDSLTEHGEYKNKSIPDGEKQSITAATKGNIIGITRQTIINDDMSVFSRLATMFGRAAKLSVEVDVYALLTAGAGLGPVMGDGSTLFHASHANLGTGAAISVASVYADRVVLASQKDPSKNEILDLRPDVLVLPVALGGDAKVINESQYDLDSSSKIQVPNRSRGMFRIIVDTPRLSGTRRYMFANPGIAPTIEVAFLDGQSEPFLDVQNGWRVDGVEWKVRLDYGVGAVDFRGAVTNAGV